MYHANVNVNVMVGNVIKKKWNNNKCQWKKIMFGILWNPATCSCKNSKYLENIVDDSTITCDEIIEMTKTVPTKTVLT